jgi:putative RNA 2'-phosphotransferase
MDDQQLVRVSKYLSRHLRHRPEQLGLRLEPGGWVGVEQLLAACRERGFPISREQLDEVVGRNDKQRFSFDTGKTRIRANQGHSVEVDLQLEPVDPPPILYHGTAERSVGVILTEGLRRMRRHHVHLSGDVETAQRVGARHGRPIVLAVDAAAMADDGYAFYRSSNGVWLVDDVPARFLQRVGDSTSLT